MEQSGPNRNKVDRIGQSRPNRTEIDQIELNWTE